MKLNKVLIIFFIFSMIVISSNMVFAYSNDTFIEDDDLKLEVNLNSDVDSYKKIISDDNLSQDCDSDLDEISQNNISSSSENSVKMQSDALPVSYDLRDMGYVTSTKSDSQHCYAFASIANLESHVLNVTGKEYDLSEKHLYDFLISKKVPTNFFTALSYYINWIGPIEENDVGNVPLKHVQDVIFIPPRENLLDNDKLKAAIIKYGGAVTSINIADGDYKKYDSYYYSASNLGTGHEVMVIGWDDEYSKNNFNNVPPGDGAFIIKDSLTNSFKYVSYYEGSFATGPVIGPLYSSIAFSNVENSDNYDYIYQYDTVCLNVKSAYSISNIFESESRECLCAIGFYNFKENLNCTLEILLNNKSVYLQNLQNVIGGYNTIKLNKSIDLNPNDFFEVKFKNSTDFLIFAFDASNPHKKSYENGKLFETGDISIKAYTISNKISNSISLNKNNFYVNENLVITLLDQNNNILKNKSIIVSFNGNNYNFKTNSKGTINFKLSKLGKYEIQVLFKGDCLYNSSSAVSTLMIKKQPTKIKISDKSFKKSKTKKLSAVLKNYQGKVLSGKKLTLKVNGKTYTAKTNAKGIATFKLNISKKGKFKVTTKFAGTAYYASKSAKSYITVK